MKTISLLLLVCLLVFTGCSRRYVVTLNSGNEITAFGKPKMKDGAYYVKDAKGEIFPVSAARVRSIQPESMVEKKKSPTTTSK